MAKLLNFSRQSVIKNSLVCIIYMCMYTHTYIVWKGMHILIFRWCSLSISLKSFNSPPPGFLLRRSYFIIIHSNELQEWKLYLDIWLLRQKKKLLIVRVKANKNTMIIFFPYLVYLSKEYSLSHSWGTETKIK